MQRVDFHMLPLSWPLFKGDRTRKTHWMEPFRSPEDGRWEEGRWQSVPCPNVRAHRTLEGDGTLRTLGLGPPSMPFKCSGSFFSDQRHMKHVPIFYKLGTQGITLQLEDQKVGRGRLQGRQSWTQIPESTVLTPAHLSKIFLFLPLFFFSSLFSVSFQRPLSWTFHGTFWEQGWPRKECLFEWFESTCASQCNFPLCGSALKSEVVWCTQWPSLPYLNTL